MNVVLAREAISREHEGVVQGACSHNLGLNSSVLWKFHCFCEKTAIVISFFFFFSGASNVVQELNKTTWRKTHLLDFVCKFTFETEEQAVPWDTHCGSWMENELCCSSIMFTCIFPRCKTMAYKILHAACL